MGKIGRCSRPWLTGTVSRGPTKLQVPVIRGNSAAREYIEFELDAETFEQIKAIARKEGQSPFQVCVSLLREQLSRSRGRDA
jgi:hypothetical protein